MPPFASFFRLVREDCLSRARDARFPRDQKQLLSATLERFFGAMSEDDWTQPLGLYFATFRSFNDECSSESVRMGSFLALYLASADLFDDVQDGELEATPHRDRTVALAVNSALSLLTMALDALREVVAEQDDPSRKDLLLGLFNRVALTAVGAQHRDLLGNDRWLLAENSPAPSKEQVLENYAGKTSALALITSCGAAVAGSDEAAVEEYYLLGTDLAQLLQVVDDVRDVFGKEKSPDLLAAKDTFLVACLAASGSNASQQEFRGALRRYRTDPDRGLEELREILVASGALEECARTMEELRGRIHARLSQLRGGSSPKRIIAFMADALAQSLYTPPPRPESKRLRAPIGGVHDEIRSAVRKFCEVWQPHGFGPVPRVEPWHYPICLYCPELHVIYYPDIEGLPEETLPMHQSLLEEPREVVAALVARSLPFLVAHELVHAWRAQTQRLTEDAWHEEYVADRLALAYTREHEPAAAEATLRACHRILEVAHAAGELSIELSELVDSASTANGEQDYDMPPEENARCHALMLSRFEHAADFEPGAQFVTGAQLVTGGPRTLELFGRWLPLDQPVAAE